MAVSVLHSQPSDEHELLRQTVHQFAQTRVEPQAQAHDESGTFNTALLRELGQLGLIGITLPEADGGAGLDATASCIVHEELAYCDPGFTLGYLAHALLFVNNFYYAGNAAQRARYLPNVLTGEWIGAMAMTEPAVGTDVLAMQTTARRDGNAYVL
ncbi:MAG TPA: acyl-CoA dehydrogenase family protein, partial [Kofleriaceae bacterium]|nr:acyl-CoA dehydrogenase family protein [Kofleriaceae bacterium]